MRHTLIKDTCDLRSSLKSIRMDLEANDIARPDVIVRIFRLIIVC